MSDLIIDFETLGTGKQTDNFIIVNCSYMFFNPREKNEFGDLINLVNFSKFNIKEQHDFGWRAEDKVLDWWKSQPKNIRKQLHPSECDTSLQQFTEDFVTYINKNSQVERLWSRGINFDLPILKRIFRQTNKDLDVHIPYWSATDIRTFLNTITDFKIKDLGFIPPICKNCNFEKHNSIHDISMDVSRIQFFMS